MKDNLNSWSIKWSIYQHYFWETKGWWLSIYPYTDKFGVRIDKFWGEGLFHSDFITNNPEEVQKRLVEKAFELANKDDSENVNKILKEIDLIRENARVHRENAEKGVKIKVMTEALEEAKKELEYHKLTCWPSYFKIVEALNPTK